VPTHDTTRAAAKGLDFLLRAQDDAGGWGYNPSQARTYFDFSCTQFGLLGLHAAARLDLEVPARAFRRAATCLLDGQEGSGPEVVRITERDGELAEGYPHKDHARGWGYRGGRAYGSMTCAGVGSLVICRDHLGRTDTALIRRIDQAIFDGLAWIDAHYTDPSRPGAGGWGHAYYLYALERAGILAGLREIGPGHAWYEDGARYLIGSQEKTGDWRSSLPDTAFALLFLRKAAAPPDYPVGDGAPPVEPDPTRDREPQSLLPAPETPPEQAE
jgi:hypothetical protein